MDFKAPKQELLFTLTPTKKNSFFVLKSLWTTIVSFIVFISLGGVAVIAIFLNDIMEIQTMIFISIVIFLLIWIISFFLTRMQLNAIEYKFFDKKIEYMDGFLIKNKKSIPYSRITNTGQGQSITERLFSLQHISIDTAGTSKSELIMKYLDNNEDLYDKVNYFIQENSK